MWNRVARVLVRRPVLVLAVAFLVTAALASGLSRLEFKTDQDTLINASSQVYKDDVRYERAFGGESMLILIGNDPVDLFSAQNAGALEQMETELRALPGISTVVGPWTAMQYAAAQLAIAPDLLTKAMSRADDTAAFSARVDVESKRLADAGEQSLSNPAFVRFLLFGADGAVRPSQKAAFPDANHALVLAQIAGDASIDDQGRISHEVKDVVSHYHFAGHTVLATGTPVLLDEINSYLQGGMASLGAIAVLVMIVVLWFAFRVRWRLLPLAIMGIGTVAALGAAVLAGISLSLVTISGLPIFIGLGVDFAIQTHNRYMEQRAAGDEPDEAVTVAVRTMAPPLLVAMVAGFFGFLALRLSPVPMIRDFGLLLCLGVVVLVMAGVVLPLTILLLVERRWPRELRPHTVRPAVIERAVGRLVSLPRSAVVGVFAVGLVVAAAGLVVEGRMPIQTEPEAWVSPTGTAVKELHQLRDTTGFSDQIGFQVDADDVTSDAVVAWVYRFETTEQARHAGQLMEPASLPEIAGDVVGVTPTGDDVRALLAIAPHDVSTSLVTADRKTANVVFPVGDISLGARSDLLKAVERDLKGDLAPPPGVRVTPSGLGVVGIELVKGMEANRQTLTLAALALVAVWLFVRGRLRIRSLLPLIPVAIAVGVSTFTIWALGFEFTPLTTVAAPLVIAVGTEFTVLLEARYADERRRGCTPYEACACLPRIGRAFVASGLTLVGGFAVLAASPMILLRDFGMVVAIDVVVALLSALVIMPPLLRWTDRHGDDEPSLDVLFELQLSIEEHAHSVPTG